jgi:uncharacterized protein (TIGR02588 family)
MSRKPSARRTPHPLEWSIGAASACLVAALIGAVLWQALDDAPRVPELSAHVDAIEVTPAGFRVRFTAANSGNATAAAVEIVGTLTDDTTAPESSGVTLDYVPAHSTASGWLLFDRDPRLGRLAVSPRGFAEP